MEVDILKKNYIQQDKSVKVQDYFKEKEYLKQNNLENVEIVNKVKSLGKDDFLKLLITQLSHQDPTKPMTDQEFIAQMAQFSALEQMQNIYQSINVMNQSQNFYYLGKFVVGKDAVSGNEVSGKVDAIFKDETGEIFLKVNSYALKMQDIKLVGEVESFMKSEKNKSESMQSNLENNQQNPRKEYNQNLLQIQ
ncbi:MAG: flagellar hook capping FlgD N-terminal domain-containing protein [Leptonema sp. (in: bacteria)]